MRTTGTPGRTRNEVPARDDNFIHMDNDNTEYIEIRGARAHNLKGVSLSIPRDKFVVITGLSGSGKSSLAFDTIYAEGQRRYMDTLSAYAKQFMGILEKPEVESISGFVGDFTVEIRKKARSVDMSKCTGCGVCQEKCPSRKAPNEFNRGLDTRSAIYTPFAQAIPNVPVIDREHCIKFKTGKCGVCAKVCQAGAIDYEQKDELITRKYGAIVAATGFDMIKLDQFDEFAYSQSPDVVTSLELERIMNAAGPTKGHLE